MKGTNSSADSRAATSVNYGRELVGVPKGDFCSQAGEETDPSPVGTETDPLPAGFTIRSTTLKATARDDCISVRQRRRTVTAARRRPEVCDARMKPIAGGTSTDEPIGSLAELARTRLGRRPACPLCITARAGQRRMFTARAATNSTVVAEIADSASIIIFTRRVSGIASVGLNAMALVNEMYT